MIIIMSSIKKMEKMGERSQQQNYSRKFYSWALVAHTYNPSYSGGRDQEDRGSKPAWANSF
jgi:hypothetical protein